jgi:hypothetical protein
MSRSAATTGFSLDAQERAALDEFQDLVGVSSRTEALRRYFLADLPQVNARLRALRESGLEPSERPELEQAVLTEDRDEVRALYRSSWDADEAESLVAAAHAPAFR